MTFVPDKTSKVPIYRQLGDYLIDQIREFSQEDEWYLLTEREMCCAYGVSRSTVRQALQDLEFRHYIDRKRRKGTCVVKQDEATSLMRMYSFTKEMERQGKKPFSKMLSFRRFPAPTPKVRQKLELAEGEEVFELVRLRYADGAIKMIDTGYLPCKKVPELTQEQILNQSLYAVLEERYGIKLDYAVQEFEVAAASHEEAAHLQIQAGDPVMLTRRTAFSNGEVIEYSKGIVPQGVMRYQVELRS